MIIQNYYYYYSILFLETADKDDVLRYAERLSMRCLTVDVLVKIQRDQIQEEALHQVLIVLHILYHFTIIFFNVVFNSINW